VAVGTHRHPFDRLLSVVDRALGEGVLPAPVTAQSGYSSYEPTHYSTQRFLTRPELESAIATSEYVVCHAGSGIIAAALRAGRKPMVLARSSSLGEHVDDHQLQLLERLTSANLIVPIRREIEPADLEATKTQAPAPSEIRRASSMSLALERWLDEVAPLERVS
jgi:UDP-N-acetylglucosamine transferase subunit ALG13